MVTSLKALAIEIGTTVTSEEAALLRKQSTERLEALSHIAADELSRRSKEEA